MDQKSALNALRVIDSAIFTADRQGLSSSEVDELRCACETLTGSVKSHAFAAEKASWLVEVIHAGLIQKRSRLNSASRDFILDYVASLSLYIESHSGFVLDAGIIVTSL